jgi:hypothetical protein
MKQVCNCCENRFAHQVLQKKYDYRNEDDIWNTWSDIFSFE